MVQIWISKPFNIFTMVFNIVFMRLKGLGNFMSLHNIIVRLSLLPHCPLPSGTAVIHPNILKTISTYNKDT